MATKINKPQLGEGLVSDLFRFFGADQAPDPSDLVAPIGMARMGRSGQKFIDLFVGKEGRIFDTDPTGGRIGTHQQFVKDKFNQKLSEFIKEGGVRGSESGLEFAVNEAGKPIAGKQTLDRSLQTMLRSFTERGFSVDEPIRIDKLLPSGKYESVEVPLIKALQHRFK